MASLRIACVFSLIFPLQIVVEARLGMRPDVLTSSNFEAFIKNNDKVLVDFFDPSDPRWREGKADLDNAIRNVRNVGSKVPFATVDVSKEKDLAAKYVPDGKYPQLMWFLHGEATQYHRTLRTAKAIGDFVMALDRDPMVAIKTEAEARDFSPAILARVSKSSPAYKALAVVASKHMDTVAFTYLEGSSNEVSWLPADASPTKFTGDLTVEAIEKWVKMLLLKSEPIPDDPSLLEDEGSKVVVGRNFEDIVLQKDKDVMLLVYAPWCGFCKKFSPIWNSFAQMVSGASDLVIAKMDGSRNGTPLPEDFSWDAYPKIFFVRAGEKKPIHFEGERSVEKLLEFVEKNGSKPLKIDKADKRDASVESVTDL